MVNLPPKVGETTAPENGGFSSRPVGENMIDNETRKRMASTSPGPGFWRRNRLYLALLGVGVVALVVGALFIFVGNNEAREAKLNVSFETVGEAESGSDYLVKLQVANEDSSKLVGLKAELVYPAGAVFVASEPRSDNISGTTFTLPDLPSGAKVTLFLKLRLKGGVGETQKLQARVSYGFSNLSARFTKSAEQDVVLSAAGIVLDVQGPKEARVGELLTYNFFYRNDTEETLRGSRVVITPPGAFTSGQSTPPASNIRLGVWELGDVPPEASGQIIVVGNFSGLAAGHSQEWRFSFEVASGATFTTQADTSFATTITSSPLSASLELAEKELVVADPGQRLEFVLRYANNTQLVAKNVVLNVLLDSPAVDLSSVQAEGAQVSGSSITWNAGGLAELSSLRPGQSGNINFSLLTKNPPVKDTRKNVVVKASAQIRSEEYQTFLPGNTVELKLSSIATLGATVGYVSGAQPPRVGQETVYEVSVKLTNLTNDFSGGVFTATLPLASGSFLADTVSGSQNVKYDSGSSRLTWTVGDLPAHTGDFKPAKTMTFRLRLVPSSSQASSTPVLVKDLVFRAKDSFTGREVELKTGSLTTASAGQGFVSP